MVSKIGELSVCTPLSYVRCLPWSYIQTLFESSAAFDLVDVYKRIVDILSSALDYVFEKVSTETSRQEIIMIQDLVNVSYRAVVVVPTR